MTSRIRVSITAVWLFLAWLFPTAVSAEENMLRNHPVPYLALHGEDPIHWQTWGPEVMQEARRSNRIVLLSIGYFSCHWCHIMQRESFQNPEIADFVNRHFIPVKVDKEMNPVLDNAMMSFAQTTLGRAGWPLNVFITPDGIPIYALLYLPPERFRQVLERLHSLWTHSETDLRRLVERFPWRSPASPSHPVDDLEIQRFLTVARKQILEQGDHFQGGFGNQNKFPSVPQLDFLLASEELAPDDATHEFLITTLDAMADLGLRDHLAGGFFRYTVDPGWEIPHFEKMLYDNAILAALYLEAGRILEKDEYLHVARETLEFLQRHMWGDGALVSSLSAVDDHDVEGGAYLWQPDEVRMLLDDRQHAVADAIWKVSMPGELEAGNHLRHHRSPSEAAQLLDLDVPEVEELLHSSRERLLQARLGRVVPVDHKLVSGWNGLALSAFVRAAGQFPDDGFDETAMALKDFLLRQAWIIEEDGSRTLARAVVLGSPRGRASLEDYAYVARGLYDWAEWSGENTDYESAAEVARAGWNRYFSELGWYRSPELVRSLPETVPVWEDGPTHSPSATLLEVSARLARILEDRSWSERIRHASRLGFSQLAETPYWYASQLTLLTQEMVSRSD